MLYDWEKSKKHVKSRTIIIYTLLALNVVSRKFNNTIYASEVQNTVTLRFYDNYD